MSKVDKLGKFVKELDEYEFNYLKFLVEFLFSIRKLAEEPSITRELICEIMEIEDDDYPNFMSGDYTYRLSHLSGINLLNSRVARERAEKEELYSVTKTNEK